LLDSVIVPINRAGWPFVAGALIAAVLLGLFWTPLLWLGLIAAGFCAYFFRDPPRVVPVREGLIVSPADGKLLPIVEAVPPAELEMGDEPLTRLSIFLNVFNVHVNRVAVGGEVTGLSYNKGAFVNASFDKASDLNERMSVKVRVPDGRQVVFVQIAGLVARRIICNLEVGQQVRTGEVFGLIRFGSRTDIYLPKGVAPLVAPGQTMVGGETVLADMTSDEPIRAGEER